MADFTELKIDGTGKDSEVCGPYHMNRHRIYFRKPTPSRASYVNLLYSGFSRFLKQDAAVVDTKRSRKFEGKPAFAFTGAVPLPIFEKFRDKNPHEDWVYVVQKEDIRGFTAQTLKRNYLEKKEIAALALAATQGPLTTIAIKEAIEINKHHFLAGRRSWVIRPANEFDHDHGKAPNDPDLMIFETAAIERASLPIYAKFRSLFDEQTKIIWATLLSQYVTKNNFDVVKHEPWSGRNDTPIKNVSFIYGKADSKEEMEKMTSRMRQIHKHLWPSDETA